MNIRKRKEKRRRLIGIFLAAAVLMSGFPVQASEFGPPVEENLFSDGEENNTYVEVQPGKNNETPDITDTIATPTPSEIPDATVTPTPSEIPDTTVTQTPSVSPTPVITDTPTVSPTPTIVPAEKIQIRFADASGKYYDNMDITAEEGSAVKLPNVPNAATDPDNNGNIWKLENNKGIDSTLTFEGGKNLLLDPEKDWYNYVKDGTITLYAVKEYKVTFYNNSGTGILCTTQKAYEGGKVTLPYLANGKYFYYGWTSVKGGQQVQYFMKDKYRVTQNVNLYVVRLTAMSVTFLQPGGSSTNALKKLAMTVPKGTKITMPAVPNTRGYKNLGWATTKNASKAGYAAGKKVTVTKNLTFYAVRKKLAYTITFNNNSGTSSSSAYTNLKIYADKNQKITLPQIPKAAGYQNIGWTTKKNGSKPLYKAGSTVKVTGNMKFYAVRRKSVYYTVNFYLGNGSTNAAYKKLAKNVEQGTTITFPSVPSRTGYMNLGWSGRKNAASATSKKTYKVNRNVSFYAVQKKTGKVVLHYYSGNVYSTTTLAEGSSYTLPCVKNAEGYTFMGWSKKPYQTVNPDYEAEEKITVKGTIDLYAVVFNQKNEVDISADNLPQANLYKYKRVIFVGDSRTVYMKNTLDVLNDRSGYNLTNGVDFICKAGEGYEWLMKTAYPELLDMLKGSTVNPLKSTAVIFNLGVNDLGNLSKYVDKLNNEIAPALLKKGCKLYVMSVNPVNRKMLQVNGKGDRSEATIRKFNDTLKTSLPSYTYIDMYSYLKSNGYGFSSSDGTAGSTGTDDGLHYTAKTYKRIYAYCMNRLG